MNTLTCNHAFASRQRRSKQYTLVLLLLFLQLTLLAGAGLAQTLSWTGYPTNPSNLRGSSINYLNGRFIAGGSNTITTSADGVSWSPQTVSGVWNGITYGNGKYVAVAASGSTGKFTTSSDGSNWASPSIPPGAATALLSVAYGAGTFVAVGAPATIIRSLDGIDWGGQTVGSDIWHSVVYANNKFVAVGASGAVTTSTDGNTWSSPQTIGSGIWNSVTYGNNQFVAVGTSGIVMTSPDGTSWTPPQTVGSNNNTWTSVTYGNGLFVAVSSGGAATSYDGVTWSEQTIPLPTTLGVTYGSCKFVAVIGSVPSTNRIAIGLPAPIITPTPSSTITQGQSGTLTAQGYTTYTWSTGETSSAISASTAATYSVTGVSGTCSGTASFALSVTEAASGLVLSTSASSATSCADSDVGLSVSASGATGPYTYNWLAPPGIDVVPASSSATVASVSASADWYTLSGPQTFTVTVAAAGGTPVSTTTVTVTYVPLPTLTITANPSLTIVPGQSTTLTAAGATAFTWLDQTPANNTPTLVVNTTGTYGVQGTTNGCSAFKYINVVELTCTTSLSASAPSVCLGGSLNLSASTTSGVTEVGPSSLPTHNAARMGTSVGPTYSWAAPAGADFSGPTNTSVVSTSFATSGVKTFTVTVTTDQGCISTATVSVTVNAASVSITANPSLTITSGQSATLTASGGSGQPATSYTWSTGETTASISVTAANTYSVTGVTGGCSATASAAVSVPVVNGPTCDSYSNNSSHELGESYLYGVAVSGNSIYVASYSNGLFISPDGGSSWTTKTTTNGLAGNYLYSVHAQGGTLYVGTDNGLSISTNEGGTFINKLDDNTVYSIYALGANVYAATTSGLFISTDGGDTFANKTTTDGLGSNYVYGVYAVGNTIYAATYGGLSISTDGGTTFINKKTTDGLGNNFAYKVYAQGNTIYAATYGGGLSISTDGGASFITKKTTDGLGSNYVYGVYAVGNTVYASTDGGLSISTDGGATFTNYTRCNGLGSTTVYDVAVTSTQVYVGTGAGFSSCSSQPYAMTVAITPTSQTITQGQSATLTASGADSYIWSTGKTTASISVTAAGTYSVTGVTEGCSATASAQVSVTAAADPCAFVPANITVVGSGDCSVDGTYIPAGQYNGAQQWANGAFYIRWAGTQWELYVTGDDFQVYTNATGSTSLLPASGWVAQLNCPVPTFSGGVGSLAGGPSVSIAPTSQTITSGGSVTLTASGATSYLWSNGSTDNPLILSNITSATTLSVTGTTGQCSATATATISVTACTPPTISITATPSLTIVTGNSLTLTASGANSYTWNTGEKTASIVVSPTESRNYGVTGAALAGCTSSTAVHVDVLYCNTTLTASASSVCVGNALSLTATGTVSLIQEDSPAIGTPAAPSPYAWVAPPGVTLSSTSTSVVSASFTTSGVKTFTATVTSAQGCVSTSTISVTANALPAPFIAGSLTICTGQSTTLTASGDGTYLWSTNETSAAITVSPTIETPYSVTLTNANGCTATTSANVTVNALPTPGLTALPSTAITGGVATTLVATGGTSYAFSGTGLLDQNTTGGTATANQAGVYSVTVTNTNGCSATTSLTLTLPTPLFTSCGSPTATIGQPLQIIAPVYNCVTGIIQFRTLGGDGSTILYGAIGVTSPTTSCTHTLDAEVAQDIRDGRPNVVPFTLVVEQSGQRLTYTWDALAACASQPPVLNRAPIAPVITNQVAQTGTAFSLTVPVFADPDGDALAYSVLGLPANGLSFDANARVISGTPSTTGVMSLTAVATDPGNLSATAAFSISVVAPISATLNVAPVAPSIANQVATVEAPFVFGVPAFSDANGDVLTYSATGLPANGLSFDANTRQITGTPSTTGTVSISVKATDPGNLSATATFSILVSASVVSGGPLTLLQPIYNCQTGAFTFRSSGGNGGSVEYMAIGITGWTTNAGPFTVLPANDAGPFTLLARQNGAQVSLSFDWKAFCATITPPVQNQPPVATAIANQTATVGQFFSMTIPAFTDPNGDALAYALSQDTPSGLLFTLSTRVLSGIPSSTGVIGITVVATDPGSLSASSSFSITVLPASVTTVNPPTNGPLVMIAPIYNCSTGAITFRTTGGDGTPIEYFAIGITSWNSSPNQQVEAGLRGDPSPVTLHARQSGVEVTYVFDLKGACSSPVANRAPVVSSVIASQTATVGQAYSFPIPANTFTDPDGQALVLTASGLPSGLSFSSATLSGTPSVTGTSTITVVATDPGSLSVSTSFTLTVLPISVTTVTPPTGGPLTLIAPTYNCSTGAITFNTTGGDGTPIQYFAIGITPWTSIPNQQVEAGLRGDPSPVTLHAKQSGIEVTYVFDLKNACASPRLMAEPIEALSVKVLGNPTVSDRVEVEISGALGQALRLELFDSRGVRVSQSRIEQAVEDQRATVVLGESAGLYLLQVSTDKQKQMVKVIMQ